MIKTMMGRTKRTKEKMHEPRGNELSGPERRRTDEQGERAYDLYSRC